MPRLYKAQLLVTLGNRVTKEYWFGCFAEVSSPMQLKPGQYLATRGHTPERPQAATSTTSTYGLNLRQFLVTNQVSPYCRKLMSINFLKLLPQGKLGWLGFAVLAAGLLGAVAWLPIAITDADMAATRQGRPGPGLLHRSLSAAAGVGSRHPVRRAAPPTAHRFLLPRPPAAGAGPAGVGPAVLAHVGSRECLLQWPGAQPRRTVRVGARRPAQEANPIAPSQIRQKDFPVETRPFFMGNGFVSSF